jgi:hypothetical protein
MGILCMINKRPEPENRFGPCFSGVAPAYPGKPL